MLFIVGRFVLSQPVHNFSHAFSNALIASCEVTVKFWLSSVYIKVFKRVDQVL